MFDRIMKDVVLRRMDKCQEMADSSLYRSIFLRYGGIVMLIVVEDDNLWLSSTNKFVEGAYTVVVLMHTHSTF